MVDYLTISLKEIISANFDEFKAQINNFSFKEAFSVDDNFLKIVYDVLQIKYCNSYIRYETANLFLNALEMRIYNIAPIYAHRLEVLKTAITELKDDWLNEKETTTENNSIINSGDNQDIYKSADTPTTILDNIDIFNKYVNMASKTNKEYNNNVLESKTKVKLLDTDIMTKIKQLVFLKSLIYEDVNEALSDLFIQVY